MNKVDCIRGRNKAGCVPTRQTPPYSAEYRGRVPLSPADKNISLDAGFCQVNKVDCIRGRNKAGCVPTRQTPPYSAEYRGRVPLSPADKNISLDAGFCQVNKVDCIRGRNKAGCVPTRQTPPYSAEYRGRVPLSPADKNISLDGGFCQGKEEKMRRLSNLPYKRRTQFNLYQTITFEKTQKLMRVKHLKCDFSDGGKMAFKRIVLKDGEKGKLVLKSAEILSGENNSIPEEFLLLPKGKTEFEGGYYILDDKAMDRVIENFKKRGIDIVVDYEHQTIYGETAPAAGWIKDLKKTPGGIVAKVEWTSKAKEFLKNKEYRYFSPVINLDSKRRVISLHSVALTNAPRTYRQVSLVAKNNFGKEAFVMNPEILKLLGLPEDASEKEVLSAISDLKQRAEKEPEKEEVIPKEVLEALGLEKADKSEVIASIHALKQEAEAVKVEEFVALKKKLAEMTAEKLVEEALEAGKILPAQKEWALKYAMNDEKGFKAFMEKAPQVAPLKDLPKGKDEKQEVMTETLKLVAENMGVSIEDIKKYGGLK